MRRTAIFLLLAVWTSLLNAQWVQTNGPEGGIIRCFAVSGTNLFAAGTYGGVFLSTNSGTSWTAVNSGLTNTLVNALVVSPNGAGGTNLFAGTEGGVFLSTNAGTSWTAVNTGLTNTNVRALAVAGTNLFAGTDGGVFLSTNSGTSWTAVNTGLTNTLVNALVVSPNGAGGTNLFAGTQGGVFLSTNNGTSWTAVNTGLTNTYVWSLAVAGTNLFSGTVGGVFLSTNNGTSWAAVNTGLTYTDVRSLAVAGTNLFAGTYGGGVFLSTDNGTTWTAVNSGLTSLRVFAITLSGSYLFAGTYGAGVFLSTDNGTSWTAVNSGLTIAYVPALAVSGTNLFAGTVGGVFLSTNNGTSWTAASTGLTNSNARCFAISGGNLFAGTDYGVFLSTNNGTSWTTVNTGLTNTNVRALAVAGTNLFAGTYAGGVFLSTDNGTSWTGVNSGLTNTYAMALATSGTNLFAGTVGGVFLSTNNGTSWTAVNTGLTNTYVWSLAVAGTNLFAGTVGGVFLSANNGTSWTAVNTGLTNTLVFSLAVFGTNVFAGTAGGVFLSTNNGTSWTAVNTGLTNTTVYALAVSSTNLFIGTDGSGVLRRPLSEFGLAQTWYVNVVTGMDGYDGLSPTVNPPANGPKQTIGNATTAASPGDIIVIDYGNGIIYNETVVASKKLTFAVSNNNGSGAPLIFGLNINVATGPPNNTVVLTGQWTFQTGIAVLSGALTLGGNVRAGGLSVSGPNGALNLGAGLSHQVNGHVTITDGTLDGGSSILAVSRDFLVTGGTFTPSAGEVRFIGGAPDIVGGSNLVFNNLTLAKNIAVNNTVTLSAPITVNGNLTIIEGKFNTSASNFSLTLGGDFTNSGTFIANGSDITIAGTTNTEYQIAGFSTTGAVRFTRTAGTATFTGDVFAGSLTVDGPGGTLNLGSGIVSINGSMTIANGTLDCGSSPITLKGDLLGNGGTFIASSSTVNFNGSTPQTIGGLGRTFNAFRVDNTTGVTANQTSGTTTVNTFLKLLRGTLTLAKPFVVGDGALIAVFDGTLSTYPTFAGAVGLNYSGSGNYVTGYEIPPLAGGLKYILLNGPGSTVTLSRNVTLNEGLEITTGTLNTSASNFAVTLNGSFTNNGTFIANGSNITIGGTSGSPSIAGFSTTGALLFTRTAGTATFTGPVTAASLSMTGTGGTLDLGSGAHQFNGSVTITSGTLNGGSSTLSLAGNFTASPGSFTPSTGVVKFNGGVDQTIGGSPVTVFNNLTLAKPGGTVILGAADSVNGMLDLGSNKIMTGPYTLAIGSSGNVDRTTGYVVGNLQKFVPLGTTIARTFEIGDASNYAPVSLVFAKVSTAGNLTVNTTGSEHPDIANSGINVGKDVNRYWTLTSSGIALGGTYDLTFNFQPGDVAGGANTNNFIVAKNNGGTWSRPTVGAKTGISTEAIGLSSFSDFALGEPQQLYTISGNAGIGGATLSYTDGSPKTTTADGTGAYSFTVSGDWSGTVTPSLTGNHFSPPYRSYSHVTSNEVSQDYIITVASELQQITLAPGYSAEYFYRNSPSFDGIAARGDGKLLVVMESAGNQGVYLATKGQWWNPADAYSSVGTPFNGPDDMIFARNGTTYVVDNGSWEVIQIPPGGGVATPFVTRTSIPTFDPLGITIAPLSFNGTNVKPGDLIVADNAQGGPARAVWAIDPASGNVRGAIAQGPSNFNDGPIQVAFGLDGRLFVYENSSGTGFGRLVTIDAAGNVTPFLTNIPGTGNLAIHPVTGDVFFAVWKSGVPGAKILRIPATITPQQTYPGSAVEVASGFSSLQDMEFGPDGNTLFVSARISTTWDILAISTPPQLTVDWYVETPTAEDHMFRGIAVDKTGSRVYISDSQTDMVYIFPNNGSNVPISSFGHPSWRTIAPALLGPYGIDVSDDDYVYIAVWKTEDANNDGYPDHALWRSNLDGGGLTQLCILPDAPRGLHVSGTGANTVVYISGNVGKVIRCKPITGDQFSAQIPVLSGILLNQQDVVANRAQSSIYVSSWYDSNSPYNDPVTRWDTLGNRDVGFSVGCARRGNTPGIDFDRSESALYLFNIDCTINPTPPPGMILDTRIYKVDGVSGSGVSCVTVGPGGMYGGGGINVGRDGKIYIARTLSGGGSNYVSSWGRITDLSAATPPEFQNPAGTASEVYAEGIIRPVGLAVDGQHRLLVAESGTGNIYRYDSKTSKVLLAYGFDKPFDLLLKGDVLYVVDQVAGKIFEKNISVGTAPFSKSSFSEFSSNLEGPTYAIPGDLAGYSGKLLVSAGGGIRLVGDGNSVFMNASTSGSAVPQGMVITPTGDMYVCVQGAGTTLKAPLGISTPVDPKTLASVLSGLDSPGGIALGTDDRLYVATKDNIVVSRRDSKMWTPFVAGLSGGEFNNIEYAGNGEFYVADYLGNRILRVALPQTQRAPSSFPLVYKIHESGHPNINDGTAFTAIQNSFQHWQDIPTCAVTFQDGGRTPSKYASMTDGVNLVTFADDQFPFPPGVLAVAAKTLQVTPGQATATIIDADIVFNPEFVHKTLWGFATDTYPGLPDSLTFDIESIATHEIGHILGLIHSGAPPASMFFVLQPRKNGRTLKPDDIAWASFRYPDGNFATAYGSIKGKVTYGYDGSSVAGALLIAENTSTGAYYHSYSDVDGNYAIPGLPAGSYKVLLRALNGLVFGYPMTPANVSAYLYSVTKYTDYPGEYWNDPDGTDENRETFTLVTVTAGAERPGINFVTNKDIAAPTVAGVSPANSAAGVDVFTQVAITFSEAVDPVTVNSASVRLSYQLVSVAGTYLLINNNKTLLFTPSERLNASTVYTVSVTSGVKDLRGNGLSPAFTSSFTTGQPDPTPPTVTQSVPADGTTGVLVTAPVYVKFSKRMDPATITESSFYLSPSAPGIITITQENMVATITPSRTLAEGTTYSIYVTSSVKDAWGNSFAGFSSSFTTALSGPPSVVDMGPIDGATGVSVTSPILIDFSKPIDPATVNSQSISLSLDGNPVGGTFELLKDNSRVIFRPTAPLLFGKTYRISVTTRIRDFANRSLTSGAEASFTTATLTTTPNITSIDPPAAPPGTTIVIAGSGFDPNPVRNTISFVGTSGAIIAGASSSSSGSITTVVPDGALAGINNVTVKVTNSSDVFLFDVLTPLLNPQDNIIASASTESQPKNVAITPDGAFAYVTNFASNSVSIIALGATPPGKTRIEVGSNPYGIAITPDGTRAYVTNYGSNNVSVIDLLSNSVIASASVGISPRGVTVTPDGSRVYVANSGSNSISVIDADPFSGAYNRIIAGASTPSSPKDVEVSPDGTLAFVTGGRFLLILDVNPASASYNQIIGQAATNSETKEVAVSPDGTIAFVTTADGSILLINVYPKSPGFGQIIAGASTSSGADQPAPSPDGTRLYVTNRAANTVTVYELSYSAGTTTGTVSSIVTTGISLKLLHTITVGTSPDGIAIDPHSQKIIVVNSGSNNVLIIGVSGTNDAGIQTLGNVVGAIQVFLNSPSVSKDAKHHLQKSQDAVRGAINQILAQDVKHALDGLRQAIHELGQASSPSVDVEGVVSSIVQVVDNLVSDAIKAAKAYPSSKKVTESISKAESELQAARTSVNKGDLKKAMTNYKDALDKAQLAIKLAQQAKGPGEKSQGQKQDSSPNLTELALGQNYPNPFNSTTQIVFDVPMNATEGVLIELKVYNLLGQLVRTLLNEVKNPGRYMVSWNGKREDGGSLASGVYIVHFRAGSYSQARRIVLMQ